MAFPTSPTNGQQANINGITYTYSNTVTAWTVSTSVSNTFVSINVSANVNSGNVLASGVISATGNVSGGNLVVTGNIVDTGALTIVTSSNGNITLSPDGTGIVTATGAISTTGNITGGNILGGANVNATTHTGTTVSVSANVTGGNILTGGLISAAGNISANNATFTSNQTLSYGTANGVIYLNSNKVATSGTALVFDGTNLGLTTSGYTLGSLLQLGRVFSFAQDINSGYLGAGWVGGSGPNYAVTGNYAVREYFDSALGTIVWQTAGTGTAGNPVTFGTKMTLDNAGNLLVGTTSTATPSQGFVFERSTDSLMRIGHANGTGSGSNYVIFGYNSGVIGTITQSGTTAVAYNTSSDYRLKNSIAPMTGALAKVALLKPVTYKWNVDDSDGQGFIAHELAEVVPDCVSGEKDAVDAEGKIKPQGIDVSFLVATLTAAIQEQQALITTLTARITALEEA